MPAGIEGHVSEDKEMLAVCCSEHSTLHSRSSWCNCCGFWDESEETAGVEVRPQSRVMAEAVPTFNWTAQGLFKAEVGEALLCALDLASESPGAWPVISIQSASSCNG